MAEVVCPGCGHGNQSAARFCSSCGTELPGGEATTSHRAIDHDDPHPLAEVDRSDFRIDQGMFVVLQGAKTGARFALDSDLVRLGRHPESDIFLDDITVSRRHAEVARSGSRYQVLDVGSLNGTYVNGKLIGEAQLSDGDEVRIGKYKLIFAHGTGAL